MDIEEVVHIYNVILLSHKKHEMLLFATPLMYLESVMLIHMSDRKWQIAYDFTYMWYLNNKINEQMKEIQTPRYREYFDGFQSDIGSGLKRGWD